MPRSVPQHAPDNPRSEELGDRVYSLPGYYYFNPAINAQEQTDVFNRTWQYACHVSRLNNAGDYFVRDIGDLSVLLLRDVNGQLQAFHNVCQHRAHRLKEGAGNTGGAITCPYHNWSYRLSGELQNAPKSETVISFNKSDICLHGVCVEQFCGFVFVNLDPDATPLSHGIGLLEEEIRSLSPHVEALQIAYERQIPIGANWKNSIENYCECYHCQNQHPSLSQGFLDLSSYQITMHEKFHSHASRGVREATQYSKVGVTPGEREFGSWFIWPNFVLEVYPGGNLNVFHHLPDGPEKIIQLVEWYFPSKDLTVEQREVISFVDAVRDEDISLCKSVQKGFHSSGYAGGRLITDTQRRYYSEHAVHDFQKKVLQDLQGLT